jgi:hypothetical protein
LRRAEGRCTDAVLGVVVRRPYTKAVTIEVTNVTRFAWGQAVNDREIIIWALGSSGWLEIRPSRSYRDTYQDMVEAIEILYFAADIHSEPRKIGRGPSAEFLFQEVSFGSFRCDGVANGS